MKNRYEEAIESVKEKKRRYINPVFNNTETQYTELHESDIILYEWNLSNEQWLDATEAIKKGVYKKDFIKYILQLLFILLFMALVSLFFIIYDDNPVGTKRANIITSIIMTSLFTATIVGTYTGLKSVRKPYKRAFFMTNWGIYNGRVYSTRLLEYEIHEKENKFSLLLKQSNLGNIGGSVGGYGARSAYAQNIRKHFGFYDLESGKPRIFWNDFIYNEADKIHIFTILSLWEQNNIIKAKNWEQQKILQKYLASQPAELLEQITEKYKKSMYYSDKPQQYFMKFYEDIKVGIIKSQPYLVLKKE